ncbi:MAG TPA: ATP-binding protein, partial [Acidimicrobiales bacterium]
MLPSPGAGAAPTATTAATATTATTSGAGGARTATRSAAGSRGRSSPATTRRAGAAAGAGRAPELHRLVAPGLLAAAALVAVDLVLGLTGRRVVALQVAAAVVALAAGVALWRGALATRRQVSKLAAQLTETSVDADARQVAVAGLVVNLARRNQSLVDRQLALIGEMEQHEHEPDALADLFQLDHLATRIRRHAESLLVLAGNEAPARTWRHPVLLTEVARAAAAEVEDYQRVDVLVGDDVEVAGHVVADLAHLLAELIENATTYSPAERRVQVRSHTEPSGDATRPAVVVTVEDNGIGMTEADLAAANRALAEPLVLDLRGHTMGLHVVARLADRYGLRVRLDTTPGGGVTALVTLPPDLVADRDPTRPARPTSLQRRPAFSPITGVAPGPTPASFTPGRPSPNPSPKPTSAPATPPTPPPTLPARPATPAAATTPAASTTTATTGLPSP